MRLTRLPQENPRTQGHARRDWYRRHSLQHLRSAARVVDDALAARRLGAPATAIVLGAGACTEVPLEQLARACDTVMLVDVDVPGMAQARDEVPERVRDRVQLLAADLTGGVSHALEAELRRQPWDDLALLAGPSGTAPLDAASVSLDRCPIPDPPIIPELAPHGYGLVLSSLVLTQLFSLPLLDVLDTLSLHAPSIADQRDLYPRYRAAALRFRRRIALAHLSLLGALLAPQGAGALITDVTGYLLPPRSGAHARESVESLPVLPPDVLDLTTDVGERFALVGDVQTWRWLVSAPDATAPGREYDAAALVFRPADNR